MSSKLEDQDYLDGNILHRGKQDADYANRPPCMKLKYTYHHPFNTMVMGYLQKYTWEERFQLTTISSVE
jgi:hypothetical protein